MKLIFFYGHIDWSKFASSMEHLLGEGGGIIIAAFLKIISIFFITPILVLAFIIIPCLCAYLILSNLKGVRHEGYLHKYLQNCKN